MIGRVIAIARFTLLEGLRARIVWLALTIGLACVGFAEFTGAIAVTESHAYRVGMLGGGLRIGTVFLMTVFVVAGMVRELQGGTIDLYLSRPLSRAEYYLGRLAGYCGAALIAALVSGLIVVAYATPASTLNWTISLFCELVLIASLSLTCVITFNQMPSALGAIAGFYLLSRAIGAIRLMTEGPLLDPDSPFQQFTALFVQALAFMLPELWRYTNAAWLIYDGGSWASLPAIVAQTVLYVFLLAMVGLFDLYRKPL